MDPERAGTRPLELVVDTSVVAKLFLNDEDLVDRAVGLFQAHTRLERRLVSPFAIYYELPASLLRAVRMGRLNDRAARDALDLFLSLRLPIVGGDRHSAASLAQGAYQLASTLGCSYYDGVFLALAQRLETQLVTADEKVFRSLAGRTPLLRWLGDVQLP